MNNNNQYTLKETNDNSILSRKYRILRLLGEGSYGKAMLAEDIRTKALLVIKSIILPSTMPKKDKANALQEGTILKSLNHPNIIKFIEVIIEKGQDSNICPQSISTLYIVMDYADGGDLLQKIKAQKAQPQSLRLFNEEIILNWFTQICIAIKHIHDRRILHRDIKSQNIFLTKTGHILLGDFGIAKCLRNTIDKAKTLVGTPYYLSPEIINGEPYEYKSDIWSLGVLLYEMCMLAVPFNAQNLPQLSIKIIKGVYPPIASTYSRELANVIKTMLSVKIKQRPTINEVLRYPIFKSRIKMFLNDEEYQKEFNEFISKKDKERIRSSITRSFRKKSNDQLHLQSKTRPSNGSYDNNRSPDTSDKLGLRQNVDWFKGIKVNSKGKGIGIAPLKKLNNQCKSNNQFNFIYKKKSHPVTTKRKNQHSIDFNLSPRRHHFKSDKKLIISNSNINKSTESNDVILNKETIDNTEVNEKVKKNLILEEFMRNKQEKIKHSNQISENINNSLLFNNIKNIQNIKECINGVHNVSPQFLLDKVARLNIDNEDSIKEPSMDNEEVIEYENREDSIVQVPSKEIIPLNLDDILKPKLKVDCKKHNIYKEEQLQVQVLSFSKELSSINDILKESIQTSIGIEAYMSLYAFIKENINNEIVNYNYDQLILKFQKTYPIIPQSKLKKAITYIPDIYFLIVTE